MDIVDHIDNQASSVSFQLLDIHDVHEDIDGVADEDVSSGVDDPPVPVALHELSVFHFCLLYICNLMK